MVAVIRCTAVLLAFPVAPCPTDGVRVGCVCVCRTAAFGRSETVEVRVTQAAYEADHKIAQLLREKACGVVIGNDADHALIALALWKITPKQAVAVVQPVPRAIFSVTSTRMGVFCTVFDPSTPLQGKPVSAVVHGVAIEPSPKEVAAYNQRRQFVNSPLPRVRTE